MMLARILQIDPMDIVNGEESYVDDVAEALHSNPKLRLLFDKSRKMSDSDMDAMLAIANSILRERE